LYNAIPAEIKPPQDLELIKFPDGFDTDMSYQLREINSTTLEDMQKSTISVEANVLKKGHDRGQRGESQLKRNIPHQNLIPN
jgi:hypothetical protein